MNPQDDYGDSDEGWYEDVCPPCEVGLTDPGQHRNCAFELPEFTVRGWLKRSFKPAPHVEGVTVVYNDGPLSNLAERVRPAPLPGVGVAMPVPGMDGQLEYVPVSPGAPVRHGSGTTFHFNTSTEIKAQIDGKTVYLADTPDALGEYCVVRDGKQYRITLDYLSSTTAHDERMLRHEWCILLWDPATGDTFTNDDADGDDVGDYRPFQPWWKRPQADMAKVGSALAREGFQLVPPDDVPRGARRTPRPLSMAVAREVLADAMATY